MSLSINRRRRNIILANVNRGCEVAAALDQAKKKASGTGGEKPKTPGAIDKPKSRTPSSKTGMKQGSSSASANFTRLMKSITPGEGDNPMRIADVSSTLRNRRRGLDQSARPLLRLRAQMRSSTHRTSPLLGQEEIASPSLGVRNEQTLLDYEPSMGSPATPISDSILDKTTDDEGGRDDGGDDQESERGPSIDGEGVYVPSGMVEAVLSEETQQQSAQQGVEEAGEDRKESARKKNIGG